MGPIASPDVSSRYCARDSSSPAWPRAGAPGTRPGRSRRSPDRTHGVVSRAPGAARAACPGATQHLLRRSTVSRHGRPARRPSRSASACHARRLRPRPGSRLRRGSAGLRHLSQGVSVIRRGKNNQSQAKGSVRRLQLRGTVPREVRILSPWTPPRTTGEVSVGSRQLRIGGALCSG